MNKLFIVAAFALSFWQVSQASTPKEHEAHMQAHCEGQILIASMNAAKKIAQEERAFIDEHLAFLKLGNVLARHFSKSQNNSPSLSYQCQDQSNNAGAEAGRSTSPIEQILSPVSGPAVCYSPISTNASAKR